jgi:hypothetical protein
MMTLATPESRKRKEMIYKSVKSNCYKTVAFCVSTVANVYTIISTVVKDHTNPVLLPKLIGKKSVDKHLQTDICHGLGLKRFTLGIKE